MPRQWDEPRAWAALCDGSGCPICLRGRPLDVVAELTFTWVTSGAGASVAGYACVVSKRHVVEPYQLDGASRAGFWEEVLGVAEVLARLHHPTKMNYEIHGNTIPHLHVHLLPRSPGDGYGERTFDPAPAEVERLREALAALPRLPGG
jgi:diadenosine tetraphosphate (Ap4A) HIT family hydrolase